MQLSPRKIGNLISGGGGGVRKCFEKNKREGMPIRDLRVHMYTKLHKYTCIYTYIHTVELA